jgi:hypothetical protein
MAGLRPMVNATTSGPMSKRVPTRTRTPKGLTPEEQKRRFLEAARELGVEDKAGTLERIVRRVATAKAKKLAKPRKR